MAELRLHILNARHQLSGWEPWLTARLHSGFAAASEYLPLQDVDLVVKAAKHVIPEKGHVGYAPEKGVIYMNVDPDNPALQADEDRSLERMLAHELHHCARWDGPGYGATLGEALVSEGLAGHFAQEVYGGAPEPWETVPENSVQPFRAAAAEAWASRDYDHAAWFFGSGDLPRWLGYTMGYQLVCAFLAQHREQTASRLVHADAVLFRNSLGAL